MKYEIRGKIELVVEGVIDVENEEIAWETAEELFKNYTPNASIQVTDMGDVEVWDVIAITEGVK